MARIAFRSPTLMQPGWYYAHDQLLLRVEKTGGIDTTVREQLVPAGVEFKVRSTHEEYVAVCSSLADRARYERIEDGDLHRPRPPKRKPKQQRRKLPGTWGFVDEED